MNLGVLRREPAPPLLARTPLLCGPLYGIAVYLFMTFVVVPLSAVPKRPFSPGLAVVILLVHVVCVGLPIAFAVHREADLRRE